MNPERFTLRSRSLNHLPKKTKTESNISLLGFASAELCSVHRSFCLIVLFERRLGVSIGLSSVRKRKYLLIEWKSAVGSLIDYSDLLYACIYFMRAWSKSGAMNRNELADVRPCQ